MVRSAGCSKGHTGRDGVALTLDSMTPIKIAAIVLVAAGVLGLVYGGFSYTKDTHDAKLGPIEFTVKEKQTVNVPVWAGVGAIVVGAALLLVGGKKS